MDHLDGKLFTDDYGLVKRDIVKRKIRKQLRQNPLFKEMQ
jgi:peptide deformylase